MIDLPFPSTLVHEGCLNTKNALFSYAEEFLPLAHALLRWSTSFLLSLKAKHEHTTLQGFQECLESSVNMGLRPNIINVNRDTVLEKAITCLKKTSFMIMPNWVWGLEESQG